VTVTSAIRTRLALGCWVAWVLTVASCLYGPQMSLPSVAHSLAFTSARNAAACLLVAGALCGAGFVLIRVGVRVGRLGPSALGGCAMAAAALAPVWAATRERAAASMALVHLAGFPAFGEAAFRASSGILGAALVLIAAVICGRIVAAGAGLAAASRWERWLVTVTTGLGALSFAFLALAALGWYNRTGVAITIAVCLMAGAVAGRRGAPGRASAEMVLRPRPLDYLWLVPAAIGCAYAIVAALAPETQFDALGYHLYLPRLWLQAGHPVAPIQDYTSLYPLTWELLFGAGLVMGGVVAAKLLHTACLAMIAVLVASACRRWWPDASPYVALALLLTVPTVLWEAGTAYADLALTLFAGAGCYALARFAESDARAWAVIAAIEFGLAAATKHLGLVVLAIAIACYVLTAGWRRASLRSALGAAALIVLSASLLPCGWWVRSWRASGNPFFPEAYVVFGGGPAERWDLAANRQLDVFKKHFGRRASPILLPWNVSVHPALYGGSLGPIWIMLLPVLAVAGRRSRASMLLAAGCCAYVAVWASPISSYQMRFLVPLAPALALLGADAWQRLRGAASGLSRIAEAAVCVPVMTVIWLTLPPFTGLQESDRSGWAGWLTHVMRAAPIGVVSGRETAGDYVAREVPSYPAWTFANAHWPANTRVLTFSGGDNFYSDVARIPSDSVLARPAVWTARDGGDVRAALSRLGVDAVIFDRRQLAALRLAGLPIALPEIQAACTTEFEDRDYRLCRWR